MKLSVSLLLKALAVIAANVFAIWAVISFIIYLVKDEPFNWLSVWGFVSSTVAIIIMAIAAFVSEVKEKEKRKSAIRGNESNFQKRLRDLAEKRGIKTP